MSGPRPYDQKLSQLLEELQNDYLQKWPEKIAFLRELFRDEKWVDLEREFHKLKGTGKTYGLPEVSQITERLEFYVAGNPFREKLDLVPQGIDLLERMKVNFEKKQRYDLTQDAVALQILKLPIPTRGPE